MASVCGLEWFRVDGVGAPEHSEQAADAAACQESPGLASNAKAARHSSAEVRVAAKLVLARGIGSNQQRSKPKTQTS